MPARKMAATWRSRFLGLAVIPCLLLVPALAWGDQTFTNVTVPSNAEISGAGNAGLPDGSGVAPVMETLPQGTATVTVTSVTGTISLNSQGGFNDPDGTVVEGSYGLSIPNASAMNPYGGISGITAPGAGYLVGVFTTGVAPTGPAPASLDFVSTDTGGINTNFTTLSPQLYQVFYIGDGLTGDGSGTLQQFNVPAGATTLYLGISDAPGFDGSPGAYNDNSGNFTVTFVASLSAPAPQPTIVLTSPPIDETVVTGSTIPLEASVNDPGGILSQVQFTLNGAVIPATSSAPPYGATAMAPAPGTYVLQAVATDNLGRQSTSNRTLTVIPAANDPAAPSADLITDINGREVGAGATIVLTCEASTADGSPLQTVNFYANGTLFASLDGNGNPIAPAASLPGSGALQRDDAAASTNTLFQAAFQIPVSGGSANNQYTLLAIAFSKLGTAQTSGSVTVTAIPQSMDQPPLIALSGLTSGQHLTTGNSYMASTVPGQTAARAPAVASAPAGSLSAVAKIEYYLSKLELLNTSVTGGAVPALTFTAPAPGEYIVEAIATDTAGVASVADPITVQVDPLPVVSVSVAGSGKAVVGGSKGKVVISRTGDTSSALKVSYKIVGTAIKGVDYDVAPATAKVLIPAGSASVKIKLKPIADPAATGPLVARIELRVPADGAYTLGSPAKAKITILQH